MAIYRKKPDGRSQEAKQKRLRTREIQRASYQRHKTSPKNRFKAGRSRAKKRNVLWTLTFEEYAKLITQPCVYGGGPAEPHTGSGLDQRIPSAGYTSENAVPCCIRHNTIKHLLSHDVMLFLLEHFPKLRVCSYDKLWSSATCPRRNERVLRFGHFPRHSKASIPDH